MPRPRHANGVNRAGLVGEVVHRFEIPRSDADRVVDTIFDAMGAALARGERIELRGFGTFRLRRRRARKARDPKTGALFDVPPRQTPLFKPGKEVKAMLARSSSVETDKERGALLSATDEWA